MLNLDLISNGSGKAADTGSAVHKAIKHWHDNGQDYDAALAAMKKSLADYPLADLDDARLSFRPYTDDPRNQDAVIFACEEKVTFTLSPAVDDTTGSPIFVTGTLDQIRRHNDGVLYLHDVKTGDRLDGYEMIHHHAIQVAAYCVGATHRYGEPVQPGSIIRTRGYRKRGVKAADSPPGVFWEFPWTLDHADLLLEGVRSVVAAIRRGLYFPAPGDACSFCPAQGLGCCLPRLEEMKRGT